MGIEIGAQLDALWRSLFLGDETADRSQTLRECTHDEVYLVGQTEVVAYTTTLLAEYAKTMSLVYHDRAVVLMLEFNDFRQVSQIALHREHTVNNDEFDSLLRELREHALQIFHIVVLVVELGSE